MVDLIMRSPSHGCMNSPITSTLSGGPSSTLPLPLPLPPLPPKPRPPPKPPLPLPVHSRSAPREGGGVACTAFGQVHLERPSPALRRERKAVRAIYIESAGVKLTRNLACNAARRAAEFAEPLHTNHVSSSSNSARRRRLQRIPTTRPSSTWRGSLNLKKQPQKRLKSDELRSHHDHQPGSPQVT